MKTLKNNEPEAADLTLYKISILKETEKFRDALDLLEENAAIIPDKLTYLETRADLQFKLGEITNAQNGYEFLLKRNANNVDYMKKIEECITVCEFLYFCCWVLV